MGRPHGEKYQGKASYGSGKARTAFKRTVEKATRQRAKRDLRNRMEGG